MKLFKAEYVDPIELQARLQRYMAGTVALFVLGLAAVLFWYFFRYKARLAVSRTSPTQSHHKET